MGKSVKYPTPPDPNETAAAQGALNKETAVAQARLNMVDQSGPFGTLRYEEIPGSGTSERKFDQSGYDAALKRYQTSGTSTQGLAQNSYDYQNLPDGERQAQDALRQQSAVPQGIPQPNRDSFYFDEQSGVPRYRAITELSPDQQGLQDRSTQIQTQLLDVGNEQIGRVGSALGQPLSFDGLPDVAYGVPDYAQDRQRVEQALMERMNPYLERREEQQRSRLANQGFSDRGSQGYQEAMGNVYSAENDARLAAIAAANQEQSRLMQQAQALNAAQNAARQQGIQERLVSRQTPINEIGALMSGGQVTLPQFVSTPQQGIQAPDLQGATFANYQAQVNQANAQQQQNNQFTKGLFGLGSSALGFLGPGFF